MKSKGSILAFTKERDAAIFKTYCELASNRKKIVLNDLCRDIANSPSPKFWVSEERSIVVVSAMLRGEPALNKMRATKREMFQEIFNRTVRLIRDNPDLHLCHIICQVINSPAPKFYMTPSYLRGRLYLIRRERAIRFRNKYLNHLKK